MFVRDPSGMIEGKLSPFPPSCPTFAMPRLDCIWPLVLALVLGAALPFTVRGAEPSDEDLAYFQKTVLPILEQRCYECHSHKAAEASGGLMLDSRRGWEHGGDSGAAVVPGKPEESLLMRAVRYQDPDLAMPPSGKLPETEIAVLEQWVQRGAADTRQSESAGERPAIDIEQGREHWAFRPLAAVSPPAVQGVQWPRGDVDRFLLARLESERLRPAPEADRYTLLRRLSFDLTGLPASEEEIAEFVSDASPDAVEKLVDRLLASRGFGERWGRHWLDLVGYADQVGTANDVFAEYAWRYRDYVIDSFHRDKPLDLFLQEQIAGDLMPADGAEQRAARLTATGFLVLGDIAIVEADKAKLRVDVVDQQVDKIGKAVLAMTLGCARCHDHKFDPIRQRDYYALAGFFYSTDSLFKTNRGVWSDVLRFDLPETEQQRAAREKLAEQASAETARMKQESEQAARRKTELEAELQNAQAGLTDDARRMKEQERDSLAARIADLARRIEHAEFFAPAVPKAFGVRDSEQPTNMQITIRGNPHSLGESVPRGYLEVIAGPEAAAVPEGRSGRLELAEWLTRAKNPLTARVAVNRIWRRLFGAGLVRSVDYFGLRGETPTHPELLDWLAERFVDHGWSTKRMVRELVLSEAYRMSSDHNESGHSLDPENRLLWRMNRQRHDAEALRDGLLAACGRLVRSSGGSALPLEFLENVGNLGAHNVNPPSFSLQRFRPEQQFVRTVYLPVIRSAPQPGPGEIRNVFDFPQPAEFAGQRSTTAVPTQALFLMNAPLMRERASDLATELLAASPQASAEADAAIAARLWLRVLGRPISDEEQAAAAAFRSDVAAAYGDRAEEARRLAWSELCHALLASNEFMMRL